MPESIIKYTIESVRLAKIISNDHFIKKSKQGIMECDKKFPRK